MWSELRQLTTIEISVEIPCLVLKYVENTYVHVQVIVWDTFSSLT